MRDYLDMADLVSPTEKIRYIADYYGLKEQLAQTREECAELIVATSKFDRAKTDQDKLVAIEKITEEMADVSIMLQQLKYLLKNRIEFQYGVQNKLDRQIRRIRDEMNGESKE